MKVRFGDKTRLARYGGKMSAHAHQIHGARVKQLVVLSLIASIAIQGSLRLEAIFTETANLTYHLDAVSGISMVADSRDLEALWQKEFLKTEEDQAQLKEWARLRAKYDISASLSSLPMQFIPRQSSISISERIRIAGLQARSLNEYEDGLTLLVLPTDTGRFMQVIRHFKPSFHRWWDAEASPKAKAFVEGMRTRLAAPNVTEQVERFRRFYGSRLPDGYRAPFSLIYRPALVVAPTAGQQLEGMAVVEFLPVEKAEDRLDVVLHEFCHFLYGTRSPEDDQRLQERFALTRQPHARPSYNLLNEGMATALGNGVVRRLFTKPDAWTKLLARPNSLYNDAYIDRAGKALLRMMDEWLPRGKTMNDADFVPSYMAVLKEEFGDELTSPRLYLNEAFILVNGRLGRPFADKIRRTLRVGSAYVNVSNRVEDGVKGNFKEHPNLSAIFVVPGDQLDGLVAGQVIQPQDAAAIRASLKTAKSAIFARPRGSMAYTFVIVADDEAEASRRLSELASAKKLILGLVK